MKWISTKGKYQRKHKPVRNWTPILILLAVSSVGALMAVRGILRDQNRQEKYDLISESVHAEESSTADYIPVIPVISDDTTSEPAEKETDPEILTQYASVYEQNPDLFGWICIEDTVLDYPVLCLELVMGVLWLASACLLALRAAQFACSPKPAA